MAESTDCDARNFEASDIRASPDPDEPVVIADSNDYFGSLLDDFGTQAYGPLASLPCNSWSDVSDRDSEQSLVCIGRSLEALSLFSLIYLMFILVQGSMETSPAPVPVVQRSSMQKKHKKSTLFKTLFVSGLQSSVKKADLRRHFVGAIKVTVKPYRTVASLKSVTIGPESTVNEN